MPDIIIMADSSSDIPKQQVEEYGIEILPITVTIGGKVYREYYDIDSQQFFELLEKTGEMPKTAQVNGNLIYDAFKRAAEKGKSVIFLTISSAGSGTCSSAHAARARLLEEMDADIEIVDSGCYSYLFGRAAVEAAKLARQGKNKREILDRINEILSNYKVYFIVNSLKYLKKGGRITPAAAAIAEILDIRPILTVSEGLISPLEKVRGKKKLLPRVMDLMRENGFKPHMPIALIYSSLADANAVGEVLREKLGAHDITNIPIGPSIGSHTGPGLIGIAFFKK